MFGDYYWASGPIFWARRRWVGRRRRATRALLTALGQADEAPRFDGCWETALVFGPTNAPACWQPSETGACWCECAATCRGHSATPCWPGPQHVSAGGFRLAALTVELTGEAERYFVEPWAGQPAKRSPPRSR